MHGRPNFVASSVSLFECIGKPEPGTIFHIFMLTTRRTRRFSASSQLKWHAGRCRRVSAAWSRPGPSFINTSF